MWTDMVLTHKKHILYQRINNKKVILYENVVKHIHFLTRHPSYKFYVLASYAYISMGCSCSFLADKRF